MRVNFLRFHTVYNLKFLCKLPKTKPWFLTSLAKLVLWGESILFERDVKVWNSKTYVDRPIFGIEDKMLQKHRRWYSQFYSSDSKSPIGNLEWWLSKYTKSSFYAFHKIVLRLFNFQNYNWWLVSHYSDRKMTGNN